jgi:hypothetical protein
MLLKDAVGGVGLVLALAGATLAFANTPKETAVIDGGNAMTTWDAIQKAANRRHMLVRVGFVLGVVGALVQFAANFIPGHLQAPV